MAPGLWLAGLVFWGWFLDGGRINYTVLDWQAQRVYDGVWSAALRENRLPGVTVAPFHDTTLFLGNPEAPLDPLVLLTRWWPPAAVDLMRLAILYSAGYLGLLALGRTLTLSPAGLAALILLFNFNGFITAHLAVGHLAWLGYFLLPWLVREILGWCHPGPATPAPARPAVILFAMALLGSFELCLWCALFLAVFAVGRPRWLPVLARTGLWVAGLCAVRILPGLATYPRLSQEFSGGFPDVQHLAAGLLLIRTFRFPTIDATGHHLGWNEYDFYLGLPGTALLVAGLFLARSRRLRSLRYGPLDLPAAGLTLLSLDDLYRTVHWLPGLGVERVSTRLLILPLTFLIPVAIARVDRWGAGFPPPRRRFWTGLGLAALAAGLAWHAAAWQHGALSSFYGTAGALWPVPVTLPIPPGIPRTALAAGALITAGTLGLLGFGFRPSPRRAAPRRP